MKETDEPMFAAMITTLGAAFGQQPEQALIDAYFMALEDLEVGAVEAACREAIRTCAFFPRPVQLRRLAGEQDAKDLAAAAWAGVLVLARNSANAEHPDPVAEETIKKLGGWRKLGQTDVDKMEWVRKEFLDLYQATRRRAPPLGTSEQGRLTSGDMGLIGDEGVPRDV